MTKSEQPYYLGTLAAAYAETGRFDKAVETAKTVLALAEKTNDTKLVYDARRQLETYRKKQPYRAE